MGCRVAGSERWRESEGERGEEGRRRMEIVTRLWMRASMKPMVCETPRERNEGEGDTAVAPTAEIAHARTRSKRRGKRKKKKRKREKKERKERGEEERKGRGRDDLFAGIVINGLEGFRQPLPLSSLVDQTSFRFSLSLSLYVMAAGRPAGRLCPFGTSVFGGMERPTVPLLGAASHPATGWIYFVYLFIDLFGMISTVITGRLQDIICMIMGRANVAGRWASFIQIPIMSKESEIVLTPFRNVSNPHFSRSSNLACVGREGREGGGYITRSLYKIYLYRGIGLGKLDGINSRSYSSAHHD